MYEIILKAIGRFHNHRKNEEHCVISSTTKKYSVISNDFLTADKYNMIDMPCKNYLINRF